MLSFFKNIFSGKGERNAKKIIKQKERVRETLKTKGEIKLEIDVPSKKIYFILIQKDDFTGEYLVKFTNIASYGMDKLLTWADEGSCQFNIGFRLQKEENFLTIETYRKELKLSKLDTLSFLFDDGEILNFKFEQKGERIEKDSEGVIIENKITITKIQIQKFITSNLIKWRYQSIHETRMRTGTIRKEKSNDFREMATAYLDTIDLLELD